MVSGRPIAMRHIEFRQLTGRQRGATAVEFAFVLPLMFVLFYGTLTYGLIFLMQMSLQHAAEDGARAALQYPQQSCAQAAGHPCSVIEKQHHQYSARLFAAYSATVQRAQWMNLEQRQGALTVTSRICKAGLDCNGDTGGEPVVSCSAPTCTPEVLPNCGNSLDDTCQIVVTVVYDYDSSPFVPRVIGMGLVTPEQVRAQARLLLDGRALAL